MFSRGRVALRHPVRPSPPAGSGRGRTTLMVKLGNPCCGLLCPPSTASASGPGEGFARALCAAHGSAPWMRSSGPSCAQSQDAVGASSNPAARPAARRSPQRARTKRPHEASRLHSLPAAPNASGVSRSPSWARSRAQAKGPTGMRPYGGPEALASSDWRRSNESREEDRAVPA